MKVNLQPITLGLLKKTGEPPLITFQFVESELKGQFVSIHGIRPERQQDEDLPFPLIAN